MVRILIFKMLKIHQTIGRSCTHKKLIFNDKNHIASIIIRSGIVTRFFWLYDEAMQRLPRGICKDAMAISDVAELGLAKMRTLFREPFQYKPDNWKNHQFSKSLTTLGVEAFLVLWKNWHQRSKIQERIHTLRDVETHRQFQTMGVNTFFEFKNGQYPLRSSTGKRKKQAQVTIKNSIYIPLLQRCAGNKSMLSKAAVECAVFETAGNYQVTLGQITSLV
jgi:hypothetical protein